MNDLVKNLLLWAIVAVVLLAVFKGFSPSQLASATSDSAKAPDCGGPGNWVSNMAFARVKNAGLTDNERMDFTKTKVTRMASEKIGKDLYHQIYLVMFTEKSGNTIEVITSNNASSEECSMRDVDAFVISKHLGGGN